MQRYTHEKHTKIFLLHVCSYALPYAYCLNYCALDVFICSHSYLDCSIRESCLYKLAILFNEFEFPITMNEYVFIKLNNEYINILFYLKAAGGTPISIHIVVLTKHNRLILFNTNKSFKSRCVRTNKIQYCSGSGSG